MEKMFAGRESLTEEQFYEHYFAADGIPRFVVLGVKRVFERKLDVNFSRLQPEDDFSSNLNYFWQEDDLADVDVLEGFEKEFGIKLTQADASRMGTFRSFVEVVWENGKQKERVA
ncbi:MAG: hypothetical protein AABN33_29705 [Acidobacteriota bacterium]